MRLDCIFFHVGHPHLSGWQQLELTARVLSDVAFSPQKVSHGGRDSVKDLLITRLLSFLTPFGLEGGEGIQVIVFELQEKYDVITFGQEGGEGIQVIVFELQEKYDVISHRL